MNHIVVTLDNPVDDVWVTSRATVHDHRVIPLQPQPSCQPVNYWG